MGSKVMPLKDWLLVLQTSHALHVTLRAAGVSAVRVVRDADGRITGMIMESHSV